ncbi:hypothetical protein TI10_20600 [Photorhabdus luminescens subsp. luminescens]|uniref:Uncharacterized protein n=1 Tax=Photorhabdus luminescens subsp. mexicana TaxID=2100167 RepID=A0A4R4JM15_PHOLU|nr:hypothetical protein TI10_20600 [Photorhabdus luminescens subsp. luminescens]OWO84371.1 hypothetical protein B5C26_04920 [Photorhabdus luminescens]TDB54119.1 hypothetical protein C5468_06225 [Photorhabdus luminescens subsp. mexicana]
MITVLFTKNGYLAAIKSLVLKFPDFLSKKKVKRKFWLINSKSNFRPKYGNKNVQINAKDI